MAKANSNKATATKGATVAPTSTFNVLAQANSAPVMAAPAAPVKPAAVVVVNGVIAGAPANAPTFMVGGVPYNNTLRPHHAKQQTTGNTNRLPAGSVTISAKGALLKPGGVAYNAQAWQAIQAAIAKGPQTAATLAQAVGNGGASHITYRIKGGWLQVAS